MSTIDHSERMHALHSTDMSAIFGVNPHRSDNEVYLEKMGRLEAWAGNPSTELGLYLEPSILDIAEAELGPMQRQVVMAAEGLNFPLRATIDGRIITTGEIVEAKTSGIVGPVYGMWGDEGTDQVPDVYLIQCAIQMLCAKVDFVHLYALLGGRGIVRYRLNRDEELIYALVTHAEKWWKRHIVDGIEPVRSYTMPLEVARRLRKKPDKTITLDDTQAQFVYNWEVAKARFGAAKKEAESAQSEVLMEMGDAEAAILPDGRELTNYLTERRGYQVDPCTYRVLRLRKVNEEPND